jgi:trehalose 6-phosphate synthase/phosphatase
LILSELAGAASELGESLLVNPRDKEEVAQAIAQALTMPLHEQKQSMTLMQKRLMDYDVVHWVGDFFKQLSEVKELQQRLRNRYMTSELVTRIVHDFKSARKRLLFLDYDGTLVPFARYPKQAAPSQELLDLLETIASHDGNELVIISGRNYEELNEWFSNISVHLVAEHGASIKLKGSQWLHENASNQNWKELIRPSLQLFTERCPGSFIEEKRYSLAWHYRTVDPDLGFTRSRELLDSLFHLVRNAQLNVVEGNKVMEVRIVGVDKGTAARKIAELFPADFIMAIGDDKTDEDMFAALKDSAVTLKVGNALTAAQYNIPSHNDVINLLKQLT